MSVKTCWFVYETIRLKVKILFYFYFSLIIKRDEYGNKKYPDCNLIKFFLNYF